MLAEAIEMLDIEKERFELFRQPGLIDTGKYWLHRDLKRCLTGFDTVRGMLSGRKR